jgi:acyl carrier protein
MLPAGFVFLDRLPRTPNGKTDRNALPEPEHLTLASRDHTPPRNDTEQRIARIWTELLDQDHEAGIGIHDNFFELGGNSLLASRMVHSLREEFRVAIPLREVFTDATVAGFAALVSRGREGEALAGDASRRLQSFLDEVDDDELDRLLHDHSLDLSQDISQDISQDFSQEADR